MAQGLDVAIQRRCLRASRDIKAGEVIVEDMLEVLRPATPGALMAWDIPLVLGKKALSDISFGKELLETDLG